MAFLTILDLEIEVLASIFEFVDDESPRSTAAVARTCKSFNHAVKLIRYRRLAVQWDQENNSWVSSKGQLQQEWETVDLLRGLRHLTVKRGNLPTVINDDSDRDEDEEDDDNADDGAEPPTSTTIDTTPFSQLESLFRNASNLKTLVWKVGYFPPYEVTKAVQEHQPNAKVNLFRAERLVVGNPVRLSDSEKALATLPCLNTFSVSLLSSDLSETHTSRPRD